MGCGTSVATETQGKTVETGNYGITGPSIRPGLKHVFLVTSAGKCRCLDVLALRKGVGIKLELTPGLWSVDTDSRLRRTQTFNCFYFKISQITFETHTHSDFPIFHKYLLSSSQSGVKTRAATKSISSIRQKMNLQLF